MRKFLIVDKDSITQRVIGNSEKLVMKFSESEIWSDSIKGEEIAIMEDNGNNIKIKMGSKTIKLDYSQFSYIYDLMKIKFEVDKDLRFPTVIIEDNPQNYIDA